MNTHSDSPIAFDMPPEIEAEWERAFVSARLKDKEGHLEEAVSQSKAAWELIPEPRLLSSMSHITLLQLVRFLRKARETQEGIDLSDWIVAESPFRDVDVPVFSVQKGIILFEAGRLIEAREAFDVAWRDSEEFAFSDEDPKYLNFYLSK